MLAPTTNEACDAAYQSLLTRLDQQQAQIGALQEQLRKTEQERDEYRKLLLLLRAQNESLKRGLLGQKAERLPTNDAQLTMAILGLVLSGATDPDAAGGQPPAPEPEQTIDAHTRKKPVRKPPPTDLPRVHIEILPPEVERQGLDAFTYIGSETREVLERRSASTVVVELEYKKFVPKDRERTAATVVLAPETVELPIVRGTAGPGLLADSLVRRWQDHQPLYRLEGIYGREGLPLSRSTLCTWHEQLADLARPLVEAMFTDARTSPYLCADATGVLVQAKERCRHGHFWVLVAPQRHVLYRYSRDHTKKAVDDLLSSYAGYLVVDAHVVYDHLFKDGTIIEVGCWAHCRRYFFKALESDPERARAALSYIANRAGVRRWNLGSGFPFTLTQGFYTNYDFSDGVGTDVLTGNPTGTPGIIYASKRNGGRLPYYHRLDMSLKRVIKFSKYSNMEITASATNVYDRPNIFYYDRVRADRVNQLPFIPALSVTLQF